MRDTTRVRAGDKLAFAFCGSKGSVEDRAGLLEYIDMVLVDPATDLRGVALAFVAELDDSESLFVEF